MAAGESVLATLTEYCNNCLSDTKINKFEDYISCQAHKWACERFLRDVARSKEKDSKFYWDDGEAQKIIDWFALLRHSKGELAGKPIILNPWQRFFVCQIYGWRRRSDGRRRFKKSFVEVGRKNSKSQLEGGVGLYEIGPVAAKNGEVSEAYTAGTKRDQSRIVFNEAQLMLRGSPLRPKFNLKKSEIECYATGATIKALSKQDGKEGDGSNPAILILDEYHQHKTTEFYDLGLGASSKEPLLMIITTAGLDLTYPCYTIEYNYCKKILNPNVDVEDDEYFVDICELDSEDYKDISNLDNRRIWHKSNPVRMTYQEGIDKIEGDYKIAKEQPEHMTSFLTKMMDVWVQQKKGQYMNMAKWKDCERDECPIPLEGMPAYWGFDMSAKIDLTSVSLVVPYQTDELDDSGQKIVHYWVHVHSFIPTWDALKMHMVVDHVPYDSWERNGYLTVTDTQIVDQSTVMQYVFDYTQKHKLSISCLCFDPANASKLMMDLQNQYGDGLDIEEVYQSHKSLNEPTMTFREQVYSGHVECEKNPLFNYAMSNAVIRQSNGLIKIDKDATRKRIDPVDATLAAFKLALYHNFDAQNYGDYLDDFIKEYL